MAKHHPDLVMCRKQPGVAIGRLCEKCKWRTKSEMFFVGKVDFEVSACMFCCLHGTLFLKQ